MIEIRFKFTEEEAIRSVVEITKSVSPATIFMPWIGLILITAGIAFPLLESGDLLGRSSIPLIFGVLFGVLLVIIPFLTPYFAKKNFRSNPRANTEIKWQITKKELRIQTASATARFPWHQLKKVEEKKGGFLIFPQPRTAHWIPKHGFNGEGDLGLFCDLVRSSGVEYKGASLRKGVASKRV